MKNGKKKISKKVNVSVIKKERSVCVIFKYSGKFSKTDLPKYLNISYFITIFRIWLYLIAPLWPDTIFIEVFQRAKSVDHIAEFTVWQRN